MNEVPPPPDESQVVRAEAPPLPPGAAYQKLVIKKDGVREVTGIQLTNTLPSSVAVDVRAHFGAEAKAADVTYFFRAYKPDGTPLRNRRLKVVSQASPLSLPN